MTNQNRNRRAGLVATLAAAAAFLAIAPAAEAMTISLEGALANPASPQMGDRLAFHSVLTNSDGKPIDGVIAWISLVRIDKGKEAPVDLEDWSAHKAVSAARVLPSETIQTEWPMRLIQSGDYRVVISASARNEPQIAVSNPVDFTIRAKPVVESKRVLPISIGIPAFLGLAILWRWRRR